MHMIQLFVLELEETVCVYNISGNISIISWQSLLSLEVASLFLQKPRSAACNQHIEKVHNIDIH